MFSGEATNTNFIVFGLTTPGLEPKIYCTSGEHANHYTTDAVSDSQLGTINVTVKMKGSQIGNWITLILLVSNIVYDTKMLQGNISWVYIILSIIISCVPLILSLILTCCKAASAGNGMSLKSGSSSSLLDAK